MAHKKQVSLIVGLILLIAIFAPMLSVGAETGIAQPDGPDGIAVISTEVVNPYLTVEHLTLADGTPIDRQIIGGPPDPPPGYDLEAASLPVSRAAVLLPDFPSYDWVFGCSAVSGAMIAAYYDRNGYDNMYAGPTNGGVMPITDTGWDDWSDGFDTYPNNPLIASHLGLDGRSAKGSIDDYWVKYGSSANDPYITGDWTQHAWGTAIGDFMKTSQSAYSNTDGSTSFYNYTINGNRLTCSAMEVYGIDEFDGTYGRKLFYEARGYSVTDCFSQNTDNKFSGGFSLADFQAEIDAGHPVLLNLAGHSIVGYGYDGSTIYIRDTWKSDPAIRPTMPWGGSYSGMELLSVSIVRLASSGPTAPTLISPSGTILDTSPDFVWGVVPDVTQYAFELYHVDSGDLLHEEMITDPSTVCNGVDCTLTPAITLSAGDYRWHVRSYQDGLWGAWSPYMTFDIDGPTLISPSGEIVDTQPNFVWEAITDAEQFDFELYDDDTDSLIHSETIADPSLVCDSVQCMISLSSPLESGPYRWRIRAYADTVWSAWSADMAFEVVAPVPLAPMGQIADITPTYRWTGLSSASNYEIELFYQGGALVYTQSMTSAVCNKFTGECEITFFTELLPEDYAWQIRGQVDAQWSAWSDQVLFSLQEEQVFKSYLPVFRNGD